jgi:hypothetical protein
MVSGFEQVNGVHSGFRLNHAMADDCFYRYSQTGSTAVVRPFFTPEGCNNTMMAYSE